MEFGLKGKVALVTGSSRGIGRGIAVALAGEGCDLLLTGRDEAALEDVAAAIRAKGRKAVIVALDLRDRGRRKPLVEAVHREFGRPRHPRQQCRRDQARRLLRADRRRLGGRLCAQVLRPCAARARGLAAAEAAPRLAGDHRRHRRHEAGGAFTIGSSVNAACVAFTKALADIGKTDGVQVNSIHPSRVETERLWRRIRAEVERTGRAEADGARGVLPRNRHQPLRQGRGCGRLRDPSSCHRAATGCMARRSTSTAARSRCCELSAVTAGPDAILSRGGWIAGSSPAMTEKVP